MRMREREREREKEREMSYPKESFGTDIDVPQRLLNKT